MIFKTREDAGRQLARSLGGYGNSGDVVVLGIPRGGVVVAFAIARELKTPLDVFLSRKLGVPGNEELAFGALAAGNGIFIDQQTVRQAGISSESIESAVQAAKKQLRERAYLYRGRRPALEVEGRTVILVDDGIATGSSIYAAIHALRQTKPKKLAIAVPVAPASATDWLKLLVDDFVCLSSPRYFGAVGQFYEEFDQVTDEEVVGLLRRAEQALAPHKEDHE